ncbi:FG-GAP-like repeat-containing protein [Pelagicoccus mobilis]|uniref:VCBS repeat-containing protein n=1 Tax=Pelagicoccus mobilis TaxID=415221 RepID=A0A934S316_9BACT|nr:FG-GAP-like repeat-containing protein [Pelagicoccus mobilis]MBK1878499.1 VCBS repeat-containing protein [Pelagicoccus mobilis]
MTPNFNKYLFLFLLSSAPLAAEFQDVSQSAGLLNVQAQIEDDIDNHGGSAAVDVDGDGFTDILLAKYQSPPLLYMNNGDGTFTNEATERGLAEAIDAAAFGAGDLDNDGDPDLLIVPYQSNRFYLYLNDGSGNFTEAAIERGADATVKQIPHDGYSVGLVDYNRDGYLDIYVSQWGIEATFEAHKHSVLLRNRGKEAPGHFENVTRSAGLDPADFGNSQWNFSSGWADFDEDGWPDLALVADFVRSKLFWNNGNGTFVETTQASGVGLDKSGMGVAIADYDADGLLDFYVTAIFDQLHCETDDACSGSKLYRNIGNRQFEEVSEAMAVDRPGWGWGVSFFEYDNDGDFDLIVTNGMPVPDNPQANPASADDPTTLFVNPGDGTAFLDQTNGSGIDDIGYGRGILVIDYDNDGDEDLIVVNAFSNPIVYRSDASENGNDWIRFSFEGIASNRDGIGALVRVTDGAKTQTLVFNPTNAFIGQREAFLHFGLGASDGTIDTVEILWPSGIEQTLSNVSANQLHHIVEPTDSEHPPYFSFHPEVEGLLGIGDSIHLRVEAHAFPQPTIQWFKDGVEIVGATSPTLHIKSLANFDEGSYYAVATSGETTIQSEAVDIALDYDIDEHSVAHWWNEFMLEAIRRDFPDPTKHGRNLYHVSAAMWDAFWPYEQEQWSNAAAVFHQENISPSDWGEDRLATQEEAISHAAYTVLNARYQNSPGAESSLFGFRWLMQQLGYDPDDTSVEGNSPAAVGNRIGNAVLEINYHDGSNELNDYADTSGYEAVNDPMPVELSGTEVVDINRWQPLLFQNAVSQNGIPIGELTQTFLGVNWREVDTFALQKPTSSTIAFDPGPPPQYPDQRQAFIDSTVEVIRFSSYLDPQDGEMIDISPGARLNNPLGTNDGTGRPTNPFNGLAYQPNLVKRADYGRILAEFWADGPASETPPGHWNTLHNEITQSPFFERKFMGRGEELSKLEWDVRAYLALNGAMHDAAVAAWTLKRQYDYSRPITMIRYFGGNGQSSDPNLPSYHPDGLPLIPELIELITDESAAEGQRHHHLASSVGKVAIRSWAGEPDNADTGVGGVDWILPEDWFPYQRSTFVTPAFAAFVSGHSTFSRAAAEVMTLLTGDPFFPAGMGQFLFPKNGFLEFEQGPSEDVILQWATYYDAADQAGISRLYGGIHVRADDFIGRTLGSRIGVEAFVKSYSLRHQNAGYKPFDWVEIEQDLITGTDFTNTRLDLIDNGLPFRLSHSVEEASSNPSEAISFIPPTNGSKMKWLIQSDHLIGLELSGQANANDPLTLEFAITQQAPKMLLLTGSSTEISAAETDSFSLTVLQLIDNDWVEHDHNPHWLDTDLSSVSASLARRHNGDTAPEDFQISDTLFLEEGVYRVELFPTDSSETVSLQILSPLSLANNN